MRRLRLLVLVLASGCGVTSSLPCSTTCAGCCNAIGECLSGSDDGFCGSGGETCFDCAITAQRCFTSSSTNLRSCGSQAGGGGGAGGAGGSSGGGGGGGTCVPSTCALRCGSVTDGCGAPLNCGVCQPPVYVTLRYRYGYQSAPLNGTEVPLCISSITWVPPTCSQIKVMPRIDFNSLRLKFATCSTGQTGTDSWTIDCRGTCSASTGAPCQPSSSAPGYYWQCTIPPPAYSSTTCMWPP